MPKKTGGKSAAKTQRRRIRQIEPRPVAPAEPAPSRPIADPATSARVTLASAVPTSAVTAQPARKAPAVANATNYSYVMSDLRRIGVLTGMVVVFLVAMTFVLR